MGTIKVNDSIHVDKSPIDILGWKEYQFWVAKTMGRASAAYQETMIDTNTLVNVDSKMILSIGRYMASPQYNSYPVIGTTHDQQISYCRWRSDRVMEALLIKNDVIEYDPKSKFATADYYCGRYELLHPSKKYRYYPNYTLHEISKNRNSTPNLGFKCQCQWVEWR